MANPSKKKGTAGENEVRDLLAAAGIEVHRTAAGTRYDLERIGPFAVEALATRPDRGQWLFTVDAATFAALVNAFTVVGLSEGFPVNGLQVEVKRRKKFALHTLWDEEMNW
jgi:hypothetical protein